MNQVTYQTQKPVFDHMSKHREESWKYNMLWSIIEKLWGIWNLVKHLSVWYIFSIKHKTKEKTEIKLLIKIRYWSILTVIKFDGLLIKLAKSEADYHFHLWPIYLWKLYCWSHKPNLKNKVLTTLLSRHPDWMNRFKVIPQYCIAHPFCA